MKNHIIRMDFMHMHYLALESKFCKVAMKCLKTLH